MTMFAFVGIESATIPAGSTENSAKTVSRATIIGVVLVALIYILGSFSVMGIIPAADLAKSKAPFADAAAVIFSPGAKYLVSGGIAIAAFGALNGWMLVQGQLPYAIAKDKLFPGVFGRLNKRGVASSGMLISSLVISLLMIMNFTEGLVEQFRFLLLLSTLSVLVPYLLSAAAYIVIGSKKSLAVKSSLVGTVALGLVAFIYALWEIYGAGPKTVYFGFIYLMLGVPFYVWVAYKKQTDKAASDDLDTLQ
jgi:APA family basic amino acid/polyamine antiporter